MQQGAAEPVEAGDLERVASTQQLHHEVELRPGRLGTGRDVEVDIASGDAGAQQRVDLVVGVLVRGRDPRVADQHGAGIYRTPTFSDIEFRRGLSTPSEGYWTACWRVSTDGRLPTRSAMLTSYEE